MRERGEVWQVDFGMAQKVRPALIISIPYTDSDRALIGVIPHTTAIRGSQFEVSVPVRFLQDGAFLVQGVVAIPPKFFVRRLGILSAEQMHSVETVLQQWLGLNSHSRMAYNSLQHETSAVSWQVLSSPATLPPTGTCHATAPARLSLGV